MPLYLYIYLTYYIIKVFKNYYVSRYINEEYKTSISKSFQELLDHESYIWLVKCSLTQIKLQMPLLQPSVQAYCRSVLVISRLKEDKLLPATSLLRLPTKGNLLWNLRWQEMGTKYKKFILGSEHMGQCLFAWLSTKQFSHVATYNFHVCVAFESNWAYPYSITLHFHYQLIFLNPLNCFTLNRIFW